MANEYGLNFGAESNVKTQRGPRLVANATPTEAFWQAWRANKSIVQAAGLSVSKDDRTGAWRVSRWREVPAEVVTAKQEAVAQEKASNIEASKAQDADIEVEGLGATASC